MLHAFIVVAFFVLIHLFSNKLRFLHVIPRSKWLSIAGGASISYVFVLLLPELANYQNEIREQQFLGFIKHHTYFFALIGLSFFYSIERIAKNSANNKEDDNMVKFWIQIAAFAIYNAFIGYVLIQMKKEKIDYAFFSVAMAFHFITNDYGLFTSHPKVYLKKGRWIVSISILLGFLTGIFYDLPQIGLALVFSFIAGGIILNVLKEELPEERASNYGAFWLGIIGYSSLILFF